VADEDERREKELLLGACFGRRPGLSERNSHIACLLSLGYNSIVYPAVKNVFYVILIEVKDPDIVEGIRFCAALRKTDIGFPEFSNSRSGQLDDSGNFCQNY
jgi:hypothetical protein